MPYATYLPTLLNLELESIFIKLRKVLNRVVFAISFFEIYGGRLFDLLNNRNKLALLEDAKQKIQVQGLIEKPVSSADEMLKLIEFGHGVRTTHATTSNDTSSRSHAICQIHVRDSSNGFLGKFLLVDLAVNLSSRQRLLGLRKSARLSEQ